MISRPLRQNLVEKKAIPSYWRQVFVPKLGPVHALHRWKYIYSSATWKNTSTTNLPPIFWAWAMVLEIWVHTRDYLQVPQSKSRLSRGLRSKYLHDSSLRKAWNQEKWREMLVPPIPSARSRPKLPVGTASTSWFDKSSDSSVWREPGSYHKLLELQCSYDHHRTARECDSGYLAGPSQLISFSSLSLVISGKRDVYTCK